MEISRQVFKTKYEKKKFNSNFLIAASLLDRDGHLKKERHNKGTFSYNTIGISFTGEKLLRDLDQNPNKEYRVAPTKEMIQILKTKKSQVVTTYVFFYD